MCLGVPGKIIEVSGRWAAVEIGGARTNVGLDLVPEARVGDYVLVHAGFAVQIVNEAEARITWELIKELAEYEQHE